MIAALKNPARAVVVVCIIVAATFLVYAPALRNGFVWDDTALVLRDPLIRSWILIPEGFRHFLFLDATASNFYRPLQRLSFVADYQLYGFSRPWGWHLTSIAIHACAAVALFFLVRRMCGVAGGGWEGRGDAETRRHGDDAPALSVSPCPRVPASSPLRLPECSPLPLSPLVPLAAATLWAIHPMHTSAVTYVSGRADPLAAFFAFSGLALGLTSLEKTNRRWLPALGAAACFLAALLSKESGAVALLIWFLMLAWKRESRRVFAQWAVIAACVLTIYGGLRFTAEKTSPPAASPAPLTVRPILAARAWAEYAGLLVAPVNLHMERDVATHPKDGMAATLHYARLREYQTLAGVLLIIGFAIWLRWSLRSSRIAGLGLSAFLIAYLPVSDLFPLNATVAEHWLYVPSAFLFTAALLTLRDALPKMPAMVRVSVIAFSGTWAGALAWRTAFQQQFWHDQRAFIEHTMAAGGDTARMRMNLANLESAAGKNELAITQYQEAIRKSPELPVVWLGYASVLLRVRDFDGARKALEKAEASPLIAAECLQTRAVLDHLESGADTGGLLAQAVAMAPKNWPIRRRYIEYLIERNDLEPALRELRNFIEAHSFRGESWKLLGQLMERMQRPDLALKAYRQAVERDVHDEQSRQLVAAASSRFSAAVERDVPR